MLKAQPKDKIQIHYLTELLSTRRTVSSSNRHIFGNQSSSIASPTQFHRRCHYIYPLSRLPCNPHTEFVSTSSNPLKLFFFLFRCIQREEVLKLTISFKHFKHKSFTVANLPKKRGWYFSYSTDAAPQFLYKLTGYIVFTLYCFKMAALLLSFTSVIFLHVSSRVRTLIGGHLKNRL